MGQVLFTGAEAFAVKLLYMAGEKTAKRRLTGMGERIGAFMVANNITNRAQFAEGVLGISKQRFQNWLYVEMRDVEAKPILKCAEALGTNPEYLLGLTDDPRPLRYLEDDEAELLMAYRSLDDKDKGRLRKSAADWLQETSTAASTAAPFRGAPTKP